MGGGVSAAILREGGPSILFDAAKKIPARLGDVVVTSAGSLPAKYIFHAIMIGDEELEPKEVIARATRRCLELLTTLELTSIAFPAIGAGVAGFSYEAVAVQMADVVAEFLNNSPRSVDATIYLYDRFGRMRPIDYVSFFEQFAVHAKGLVPLKLEVSRETKRRSENGSSTGIKSKKHAKREKLVQHLALRTASVQEIRKIRHLLTDRLTGVVEIVTVKTSKNRTLQ
jgi:O-acetyl-ADP-ribose deacetylase (regulator of RNase III)